MSTGTISGLSSLTQLRERLAVSETARLSKEDLAGLKDELTTNLDELLNNYDKIDLNGDGLSSDELQTYTRPCRPKGGPRGEPPSMSKDELTAMKEKMAEDGQETSTIDQVLEDFEAADADQDGKVSAEEFRTYAEANGLEMPEPPGRPPMRDSQSGSSEDEQSTSGISQSLVATILEKYLAKFNSSFSQDAGSLIQDTAA